MAIPVVNIDGLQQWDENSFTLTVYTDDTQTTARDITSDRLIFHIDGLEVTKDSAAGASQIDKTDPTNGIAVIKLDAGDLSDVTPPGRSYKYEVVDIATNVRDTVVKGELYVDDSLIATV